LQLAARQRLDLAVEEMPDPEHERRLLHRARDRTGRRAAMLERKRYLGSHTVHHHLRLRVLEHRAADRRQVTRPVVTHAHAADPELARHLAAVEVRNEPARGAKERRLAAPGLA